MKDKKDSKKETQKLGTLGGLFGRSITAVLRRLGREGVSTAHAREHYESQEREGFG